MQREAAFKLRMRRSVKTWRDFAAMCKSARAEKELLAAEQSSKDKAAVRAGPSKKALKKRRAKEAKEAKERQAHAPDAQEKREEEQEQEQEQAPPAAEQASASASASAPVTLAEVGNLTKREVPESTIGGETTCIVCFGNPKTHLAAPCGHQCVCETCSRKMQQCPYCRGKVSAWVHVRVV